MATLALVSTAVVPGAAASAAEESGVAHGLKGEYYTQSATGAFDFDELKATTVDPSLDFDTLEERLQARTGQADDATVRWTGKITPEKTGDHTFSMSGDNGFRLWIDGNPVIDHWVDDWDNEQNSEPVPLEAGRAYDIKVEYFEHYGGSNLHLRWTPPGGAKTAVPQSAFTLPEGMDYNGPTGVAVEASGRTLSMEFPEALSAPPTGFLEHVEAVIGGAEWPLDKARLDAGNSKKLLVTLEEPVVGQGGLADVRYDGEGGLNTADSEAIDEFWTSGANKSEYQLKTKWADEVGPDNALPEYPRPQLTRDAWKNLNGEWQFAGAEEGEQPPFGKNLDERILVPYPVESELSGIERHEERMWYRRTFTVPQGWKVGDRKRLNLNFDAVDWKADVYVNGTKVAGHKGGYDRFTADVTDALKPGRKQELVVGVYDPTDSRDGENQPVGKQRLNPQGIFYTPSSGIWQTVWMEPVSADHATDVKTTPDVAGEKVGVQVRGVRDGLPVTAVAYDGKREIGRTTGVSGEDIAVPVPDPHLWSPDDPHLYQLKVTVGEGRSADKVGSYFGMRTIAVETIDGQQRTVLNGEPVFSMATLDQGFWPEGLHTPPTDEALAYDLEMHKKLGYNSVRKHIKVEPDRWFYHADKLGLLVWQDMPSMAETPKSDAARKQYEKEMKEMIEQHDSHPSVIMWVTFNEGWGQYDQARIADYAKALDPTRLVNNMSGHNCCGAVDGGNGDISDAHGYPGAQLPEPDGERALVSGEYGGLGLAVPGHAWPVRHTYVGVERETYTDKYLERLEEVEELAACRGSSGAVYTQITDLEGELNGLLTYDRKVVKPDVDRLKAAHEALIEGASEGTLTCSTSSKGLAD
ncbi:glycoside hydrolase family 2 [Streptomyces sp. N2-109]|uniref:Glycoside hydrolase family 2 n=1 Tax=Streptomyces gossypii TaxID=2883101 RepID=A0ABT2JQZ4_9ACTN|nr:PA14 domain-containing protein [Streptomyces gossypii]MCT2590308.1 glycoside hydrolase family 2 [Streptomyces gossypii]